MSRNISNYHTERRLLAPNVGSLVGTEDNVSDATISTSVSSEPEQLDLVRHQYTDSADDYKDCFEKLQINPSFYNQFFSFIQSHREGAAVHARLSKSYDQSAIEDVAASFLTRFGPQVWMTRGKNNHQDPKFREFFFHHKTNEYLLQELLEDMWRHIRDLTYSTHPGDKFRATTSMQLHHPLSQVLSLSSISSISSEEEDIALAFINKVHVDIHGRFDPLMKYRCTPDVYVKHESSVRIKQEEHNDQQVDLS